MVHTERCRATLVLRIDNPPVNALSATVLQGIEAGLDLADADDEVSAVVLMGANDSFVAGADLTRLQRLATGDGAADPKTPNLGALVSRLESGGKPVVAAIDGFALGGGLELCLGCAARVGTERCQVGLPELRLGLIPGAGGTQRLPRLIGIELGLELMLTSRMLRGNAAADAGLLDEIVLPEDLLRAAVARAEAIARGETPRRITLATVDRLEHLDAARDLAESSRNRHRRRFLHQLQAEACIEAVLTGVELGAEAGLRRERELFEARLRSPEARALLHVFFAERRVGKHDLPKTNAVKRVTVIGGGTMGTGIATALVSSGVEVALVETDADRASAATARVATNLERLVSRGTSDSASVTSALGLMSSHVGLELALDTDLVIEAATEDVALKERLFAELGRLTKSPVVLASNTSTIPIETMAQASGDAGRILGLHFFSPAQVMRVVEVIVTDATTDQALSRAVSLIKRLGKHPVRVRSCPGFLLNRIFMPYSQASGWLIDNGIDPYALDDALLEFGMPMGPCRMSDLAGIDVGLLAGRVLDEAYPDRSTRSALRELLVAAGRLGEKSGLGHYRYVDGRAERDPDLSSFVERARARANTRGSLAMTPQELCEATLLGVVNEAARALAEGIVNCADAVDVAAIHGYGFPAFRGGPMFWAEELGLERVIGTLKALHERHGTELFRPSAALVGFVGTGFPRPSR